LTQTRVVGPRARGRSFPSGHTSQIFFTVTLLIQHFHPPIWGMVLLCLLALFVAVTRMYVGAHYPRDILAGMILGSVWGGLGVIIDTYFWEGLTRLLPIR
ncbi:MAG TPA: phosphatase PAP2 family protein, partial [Bacillota bacterium]|nr:phosphatase PAP2 family protein [Bacillota bacterium]